MFDTMRTFEFNGHELRAFFDEDGEFWFCDQDIGRILGIVKTSDIYRRADSDEKRLMPVFGTPGMWFLRASNRTLRTMHSHRS